MNLARRWQSDRAMRLAALLVLSVAAAGCASISAGDPWASVDDPPSYADESARADLVCTDSSDESTGEAQEPVAWPIVIAATCLLVASRAADYGCKRLVLHQLCPPGTVLLKTVHDTMDKNKTVTVRIPCDVIETMICGTGAVSAGTLMHHLCAEFLL